LNHTLQIEALISQDDAEVAFSAMDETTGKPVLLRRFFPFGRDGRGLQDDEQKAFEMVIACLCQVTHPALCPVVDGGVDAVDGVPFVAVEWVAGQTLEEKLGHGLLRPAVVIDLMAAVLEVAAVLSAALGRDGMWLEMHASSIVWVEREGGSTPMFRIAPVRCLWLGNEWPAAIELTRITEAALGWQGVRIPDHAGDGLGAWVNWLRIYPVASLAEIREALATATLDQVPPQPLFPDHPAPLPVTNLLATTHRRPKLRLAFAVAGVALLLGGIGWAVKRPPRRPHAAAATQPAVPATDAGEKPSGRKVLAAVPDRSSPPRRTTPPAGAKPRVFDAGEIELIMAQFHREIVMEGVVARVSLSRNRKTWYLDFSKKQPPDKARAFLPVLGSDPATDLAQLKALVGKRIRVRGTVDSEIVGPKKARRPKILIKTREALEVVK
jgi:hypothetical protein